jgi:hypothetical protein
LGSLASGGRESAVSAPADIADALPRSRKQGADAPRSRNDRARGAAKVFEAVVSGHTLKHVAAALAGWTVCYMLMHRTLKEPDPTQG